MIFISKKQFENAVRSRVDEELRRMEDERFRADSIREAHMRCARLEERLEKIEAMHSFSRDMTASIY